MKWGLRLYKKKDFLIKNLSAGKYIKLGTREAHYLCEVINEKRIKFVVDEAELMLTEEEKEYLLTKFKQHGLLGESQQKQKKEMSDVAVFSTKGNKLYNKIIEVMSNMISLKGAFLVAISCILMIYAINVKNALYVDILMNIDSIKGVQLILYLGIMYFVSGFFHESAHLAACYKYTKKHGIFGIKFYFGLPTFYVDVSDIYRLDGRKGAVVTALLGVITNFELFLVSLILIPVFAFNDICIKILLIFSGYNILLCIFNLIPFAKFDGYWIIRYFSGINNLYDLGVTYFMGFFTCSHKFRRDLTKKKLLITLYGCGCYLFAMYLWHVFFNVVLNLLSLSGLNGYVISIFKFLICVIVVYGVINYNIKYIKEAKEVL